MSVSLPHAIDFSRLCQGPEVSLKAVIQRYGAFKIKNHGISLSARNNCFAFSKDFFKRSSDLKLADPAFSRLKGEEVRRIQIPKESLYVPRDRLGNYPMVQALYKEIENFTPDLLRMLSRALALDPPLGSLHTNSNDQIALHYYPDLPAAGERNPEHRDWNLLTLLIHEDTGSSNGLEVADFSDFHPGSTTKFVPVDPGNDEITVLVGNMLPRLAKYHRWESIGSCLHRVSGTGERYSIAYFIHVDANIPLKPDGTTAGDIRKKWETKSKVKD